MSLHNSIEHAAIHLGLTYKDRSSSAFGEVNGWLTQLSHTPPTGIENEGVSVVLQWARPEVDDAVRRALAADTSLEAHGIPKDKITIEDGRMVFPYRKRLFKADVTPGELVGMVESLGAVARAGAATTSRTCVTCGAVHGTPTLLNGSAHYVCDTCIAAIASDSDAARTAHDAVPTNYVLAVAAAVVLCAVGAISWATLTVLTERMFWQAAVGIGALVAWGTRKAAGKGGPGVQLIGGTFTLASMVVGQLVMVAWYVLQDMAPGESIDWAAFLYASPQILIETGSDTIYALGAGLFGAVASIAALAKADVGVAVER